mmetsp:Transcript_13127/g.34206  ORF Transcript_13127/g.34206 Transcript_13127/m.34206 type:complete len:207 (-) Transcript_13127:62-682(-)
MAATAISGCLALAALSSISQQDRAAFASGQVWAGNYTCAQVPAWLLLHVLGTAPLRAVFHFVYPHSGTHGAFIVEEGPLQDPEDFRLDARMWIHMPRNAEMVGIVGHLSKDHSRIEGKIVHEECGRFEVTRTVVDLIDSALEHAVKTSETAQNVVDRSMAVMQYAYDQLERRLADMSRAVSADRAATGGVNKATRGAPGQEPSPSS